MTDNALDSQMSKIRRQFVSKKQADEMRYTEDKMREELDAMEDRYTQHGEKVDRIVRCFKRFLCVIFFCSHFSEYVTFQRYVFDP